MGATSSSSKPAPTSSKASILPRWAPGPAWEGAGSAPGAGDALEKRLGIAPGRRASGAGRGGAASAAAAAGAGSSPAPGAEFRCLDSAGRGPGVALAALIALAAAPPGCPRGREGLPGSLRARKGRERFRACPQGFSVAPRSRCGRAEAAECGFSFPPRDGRPEWCRSLSAPCRWRELAPWRHQGCVPMAAGWSQAPVPGRAWKNLALMEGEFPFQGLGSLFGGDVAPTPTRDPRQGSRGVPTGGLGQ